MLTAICLSVLISQAQQPQLVRSGGMLTATFSVEQGAVKVYLPDDILPGDTISGTVVAIPTGSSPEQLETNAAVLRGMVIVGPCGTATPSDSQFEWSLPTSADDKGFTISLRNDSGRSRVQALVPYWESGWQPGLFHFPRIVNSGRPVVVHGPFDGKLSNTELYMGSSQVGVLAESPRKAIFVCPQDLLGPATISCYEGDDFGSARVRLIRISLEAEKNTIMEGETVKVQLTVSGCQDFDDSFKVQVINLSPDIVQLQGGNDQQIEITEEMVRATGICGYQLLLLGRQAGSFQVQAKPKDEPKPPAVDSKKCPEGFKPQELHPDGLQGDETELGKTTKARPQGFKPDAKDEKQNKKDPDDDSKWQHWDKPVKKDFGDVVIWFQKLYVMSYMEKGRMYRGGQYRIHFKYKGKECVGGKWRQVVRTTIYVGDTEDSLVRSAIVNDRHVPAPDGTPPPKWEIDTHDAGRAAKDPDYPHQDKGEMIDRPQRMKQAFAHFTNDTPPRKKARVIVEEVEFFTFFIKDGKVCKMFKWKMRIKWVFKEGLDPSNPDAMAKAKVSSEMSDPSECKPGTDDWKAGESAHAEALSGFPK
jgi:hypothetical protein